MGGLESHISKIIYICLGVVMIVLVMATAMSLMRTSKAQTNEHVAELEKGIVQVDNDFFTEWDGNNVSGLRLKQFINEARNKDCAVLVQTLSFLGNQTNWTSGSVTGTSEGGVKVSSSGNIESIFKGQLISDAKLNSLPVVQIDIKDANTKGNHKRGESDDINTAAFPVSTVQGTVVYNSCLVNYGSVLNNAVTNVGDEGKISSVLTMNANGKASSLQVLDFDETGVFGQTIAFKDGKFYTKQEFATTVRGDIVRYDNTSDNENSGATLYIDDGARFRTYVLCSMTGKYMGVVFIETK